MGSSSLTRDWTWAPVLRAWSQPLNYQGNPFSIDEWSTEMLTFSLVDRSGFVTLRLSYIIYNNSIWCAVYKLDWIVSSKKEEYSFLILLSVLIWSVVFNTWQMLENYLLNEWMNVIYVYFPPLHRLPLLLAINMFRVFTLWMAQWLAWNVSKCGPAEPICLLGNTHEARPPHLDRLRWF